MPTLVGDRRSIFTDTARDQKRKYQRENLVEGFLVSNPARRRNDPAQSQMTVKPVTTPAPALALLHGSLVAGGRGEALWSTTLRAQSPPIGCPLSKPPS